MEAVASKRIPRRKPKVTVSRKFDVSMQADKMELLNLLLQKSDLKIQDIFKTAATRFINSNLDLLSEEEKEKFDSLIFKGSPKGDVRK